MDHTSFSCKPELLKQLQERARKEKRSVSNLVSLFLEERLQKVDADARK